MRVIVSVTDEGCGREIRIVPKLSACVGQRELPTPTPQYQTTERYDTGSLILMTEIPVGKQVTVTPLFLDAAGNPTQPDGTPRWTNDNSDVLAIEPAGDGMSCVVRTLGPLSSLPSTVAIIADADKNLGVRLLVGTIQITVTAGDAQTIQLDASNPVDQATGRKKK